MFNLSDYFFKNSLCFKFNNNYVFIIPLKNIKIVFSLKNIIKFNNFYFNKNNFFFQIHHINYFFYRFISFVGKSYKVITKNKFINFKFNRSHLTYMFFNNALSFKKTKKNVFKFKFTFFKDLNIFKNCLNKVRLLNVFTSRGLKLSKSIVFKKKGKVSTYNI